MRGNDHLSLTVAIAIFLSASLVPLQAIAITVQLYDGGRSPSTIIHNGTDLRTILANHKLWVITDGAQGSRANLSNAKLESVNLEGAILKRANLYKAQLRGAKLKGADMQEATLRGADLQEANLSRSNLKGAILEEAYLKRASLRGVNLEQADLRRADLEETDISIELRAKTNEAPEIYAPKLRKARFDQAKLRKASIHGADAEGASFLQADMGAVNISASNFSGAEFSSSDLTGATISGSNFEDAYFEKTKLIGVQFVGLQEVLVDNSREERLQLSKRTLKPSLRNAGFLGADIRKASLADVDLTGAGFADADLDGTVFEPQPGGLPNISSIASAKNLSRVTYVSSPQGLVELREALKKAGLRAQERQVTFAIKRRERQNSWDNGNLIGKVESIFNFVFFEFPCDYGMSPRKCLLYLVEIILLCSVPYMGALYAPGRSTGIWVVRLPDRTLKSVGREKPVKLKSRIPLKPLPVGKLSKLRGRLYHSLRVARIGLYFSLLSAFSIGWRDFNVGSWIARIQAQEYQIRGTGWVRTLSGVQSLISVYLLALWALTYFGRPFE